MAERTSAQAAHQPIYLRNATERRGPVGCSGPRWDHQPGGPVPMAASRPPRQPPEVVLVEDSTEVREALRQLLEAQGIVIVGEAADGATGIELANDLEPDLVLMDVKMLGMSGIEATRIITGTLPDTQVIVLTTFDDESLRRQAAEAGAADYLLKEDPPERIVDAVVRAVRQ